MYIRFAKPADAIQIAEIYNFYIENSHATFETEIINAGEMERRLNESLANNYPFFVYGKDDEILGYAYGRQFRPRRAYLHSIEISVYVKHGCERQGIGSSFMKSCFMKF